MTTFKGISPFRDKKPFQQPNNLYESLTNKDGFYITHSLFGDTPQTAGNYTHFFIARHPLEVLWVTYTHAVAGSDMNDVEIGLEKLSDTVAPASGDSLLVADFDATATANTIQFKEGIDLTSNRILIEGDRLAITLTGTPTDLESVVITMYCQFANRGSYY